MEAVGRVRGQEEMEDREWGGTEEEERVVSEGIGCE